jgi:hypothetical protein
LADSAAVAEITAITTSNSQVIRGNGLNCTPYGISLRISGTLRQRVRQYTSLSKHATENLVAPCIPEQQNADYNSTKRAK